jgi:hypothetical protein
MIRQSTLTMLVVGLVSAVAPSASAGDVFGAHVELARTICRADGCCFNSSGRPFYPQPYYCQVAPRYRGYYPPPPPPPPAYPYYPYPAPYYGRPAW